MISEAPAQPVPAASAPQGAAFDSQQAISGPAAAVSAPARSESAPVVAAEVNTKTMNVAPPSATNALMLQLPPKSRDELYWGMEPAMWAPVATGFAVVLTSLITLTVSGLTIWASNGKTKKELAEAREKAHVDRIMEARRDIYGEILADYQKVQAFIGGMASENFKPEGGLVVSDMSASVNKLWVWGDVESVYEVREFYTQVNEFYQEALGIALALRDSREFMKTQKEFQQEKRDLAAKIGEELRAHHAQPQAVQQTDDWKIQADRLNSEQLGALRDAESSRKLASGIEFKVSNEEFGYVDFIIDKQTALTEQINKVMALARKDVGLKGDVEKLNQQSRAMNKRASEAVQKRKRDRDSLVQNIFP